VNNLINPSIAGLGTGSINGSNRIAELGGGEPSILSSEMHDWFSAQTLDNGQLIEASAFDSSPSSISVDEAAQQIYSRLVPSLGITT
jgi:hypothetical protein